MNRSRVTLERICFCGVNPLLTKLTFACTMCRMHRPMSKVISFKSYRPGTQLTNCSTWVLFNVRVQHNRIIVQWATVYTVTSKSTICSRKVGIQNNSNHSNNKHNCILSNAGAFSALTETGIPLTAWRDRSVRTLMYRAKNGWTDRVAVWHVDSR